MTRNEFIKACGIFGMSLPFQTSLFSCAKENEKPKFSGKIIIIGAGAGGLSAGYFLHRAGVDFEILEASASFGGRMKIDTNFADFPIPMGAEWIESNPAILREIIATPSVSLNFDTFEDAPDYKFLNYSWFNFFEDYLVPAIADKITYQSVVNSIQYEEDKISIETSSGNYIADKVILSVPLKILQTGEIEFIPSLPAEKITAIQSVTIWDGFKAFFEFSEKFYDAEYAVAVTPESDGQKIFYDAALGQSSNKNILGIFVVGKPAQAYLSMTDAQLKDSVLGELDQVYNNSASSKYLKHISQKWNEEPFIKGGYLSDYADWRIVQKLGTPVADKLYFAGGEFTDGEDWVSVHTAALSAKRVTEDVIR